MNDSQLNCLFTQKSQTELVLCQRLAAAVADLQNLLEELWRQRHTKLYRMTPDFILCVCVCVLVAETQTHTVTHLSVSDLAYR